MENKTTTFFEIVSEKKKVESLEKEHKEKLESIVDTLEHISISGNSYSKQFCLELSEIFAKTKNLQLVNLQNIFVGRLKDEIPEALGFMGDSMIGKNVIEIDLSDNAVNPFGCIALSKYLIQANSLKKFLINNCGLGPEGTETIGQSLAKGAVNLEVLAIARNRAEDKGAKAIGIACGNMKKFRELHIYQDVIRKEGMVVLLQNLQKCENLEILDIRDNFVKEESAQELANLIKTCKNLKGLNLSDCNMEEEENELVVQALADSTHDFEKFGYNYNELEGDLAKQLLDAILKDSKKLNRLDIKGNEFKKSLKQYYTEKLTEKGFQESLSLFESDDEDEETNVLENFAKLTI